MEYKEANDVFKKICRDKKLKYYEDLAKKFSVAKESKEYWGLVKKLNGKKFTKHHNLQAETLATHFKSLLTSSNERTLFSYSLPDIKVDELDEVISIQEVQAAIDNTKLNKAPGEDGVPAEFFKAAPQNFVEKLTLCFNNMFEAGNVSKSFKNAIIFPLFKQGDPSDPTNFRGISFLNAVSKIFTRVIYCRIADWVEKNSLLSESQAGFRKNYSTIDNIFCLTSIAKTQIARSKKLYSLFVDFKAAFDSIERNALFYKLSNMGMSRKMLSIIQSLYDNNKAAVWDGTHTSEWFDTEQGVKQGCLLSPLLFALFINDLESNLPGGIKYNNVAIKLLMYADDIVLFAESPTSLQRMINRLHEYCLQWSLTVNLSKTKVMVFRNGRGRYAQSEKWFWSGNEIEKVSQYKYLGVTVTPNVKFKKHLMNALSKAKVAINSTWKVFLGKKDVRHSEKFRLFEAAVRTILSYASEVWGIARYEEVENLLRYFLKKLFRLPRNTPNYMLYVETGLSTLYSTTLKRHFAYLNRVMNMENHRLPKIVASYLIETKAQYFEEWENLANDYNVNINIGNVATWKFWQERILCRIVSVEREDFMYAAQQSGARRSYPALIYNLGEKNYFNDKYSLDFISIIFKARGELLKLNYIPHVPTESSICPLCNTQREENILHFLGECPILKEWRLLFFGKVYLEEVEIKELLNGKDWNCLYQYIQEAQQYRTQILTESF